MDRKSFQPMVGVVGLTDAEQMEIRGGASNRALGFRNSINNYRSNLRGSSSRSNARSNSGIGYARFGSSCC